MTDYGIPALLPDMLASVVPDEVFLWRTSALENARGKVLAFYVWDDKLEQLWRKPEHYTHLFLLYRVAALIEPDFSLWVVIHSAVNSTTSTVLAGLAGIGKTPACR